MKNRKREICHIRISGSRYPQMRAKQGEIP